MRTRTALLAVTSALALFGAVPGIASAAEGTFTYRYLDDHRDIQVGTLANPASGECIEIPESSDPRAFAFGPRNDTGSPAFVFKDDDCESDDHLLLHPNGGDGPYDLPIRSVLFA